MRADPAMTTQPAPDVIIVGAGMAGATLALGLASGGLTPVLIDPQPFETQCAPGFDGRASAISYAAFRQWRAVGAADLLEPHAQRIEQILVTDGRAPGAAARGPSAAFLRFDSAEIADRVGGRAPGLHAGEPPHPRRPRPGGDGGGDRGAGARPGRASRGRAGDRARVARRWPHPDRPAGGGRRWPRLPGAPRGGHRHHGLGLWPYRRGGHRQPRARPRRRRLRALPAQRPLRHPAPHRPARQPGVDRERPPRRRAEIRPR